MQQRLHELAAGQARNNQQRRRRMRRQVGGQQCAQRGRDLKQAPCRALLGCGATWGAMEARLL
jgi:hypothetical protein